MSEFGEIEFWYWWVFAVLLGVVEIIAPGFFFLWLALAAAVVGVVLLLFPELTWQGQFVAFAVLSVASVVAWYFISRRRPQQPTDAPSLNQRCTSYVGQSVHLAEPIKDGVGVLRLGDTRWRALCSEDLPAGTRVKVTAVEGTALRVERLSDAEQATEA